MIGKLEKKLWNGNLKFSFKAQIGVKLIGVKLITHDGLNSWDS